MSFRYQRNSSFCSYYRVTPKVYTQKDRSLQKPPHSKKSLSSNQLFSTRHNSIVQVQKSEIRKPAIPKLYFFSPVASKKYSPLKSEAELKRPSLTPKPNLKFPILSKINSRIKRSPDEFESETKQLCDDSEDGNKMCTIGTNTPIGVPDEEEYVSISLSNKSRSRRRVLLRAKDLTGILDVCPKVCMTDQHCCPENQYIKRIRLLKDLRKQ